MQSTAARHILIAGAGIGGLTTAVALRRRGFDVTVFERAPELLDVGAGLTIWANAIRAFQSIGLGEVTDRIMCPIRRARFVSWSGETLSESPIKQLEEQFGAAVGALHRSDLQAALLAALGPDVVRTDATCTGFTQDDARVTLRLASGEEVTGDLLIGADGLRSVIRAQLFGAAEPHYAGYTAWRGIASYTLPAGSEHDAVEVWGPGKRFGIAPLMQGRVYWFSTDNTPEHLHNRPGETVHDLLDLFGTCPLPISGLLAATDEAAILRNDIYDRPPLPTWSRGRVTLLGDAAHPMTPNLGQGACQAIEDACIIADSLGDAPSVAAALHAYEAKRLKRANFVVSQSRRIGALGQIEQPWAVGVRNALLKLTPAAVTRSQIQAILRPVS